MANIKAIPGFSREWGDYFICYPILLMCATKALISAVLAASQNYQR
ncbi:hypothetical protein [Pseudobacteroides cellulosolvens]|nr:hypothetical protein [Pseudobacteroides cellulosolvens]